MNKQLVLRLLGVILIVEAVAMVPSLIVSMLYSDGMTMPFAATIGVLLVIGGGIVLTTPQPQSRMRPREGFLIVALSWLLLSLFGAVPLGVSGYVPTFVDALFESVSGFTTTGASVLPYVEVLPPSLLFWRSFTQWLGGMGVLLLTLTLLPKGDKGVQHLMEAEAPGPSSAERIVPRLRDTAVILYGIYLAMSVLQTVLLLLGGMPLFDALIHMFSTAGTGGFSNHNLSVGVYNNIYFETVIATFLLLFATNFNIYFLLIRRNFQRVTQDSELKAYISIFLGAVVLILGNLFVQGGYTSLELAARHAYFQVASIVSTAGFSTTDYNLWPEFSKNILLMLMIVGSCASSTGGGLKIVRVVILFKAAMRELKRIMHPRSVNLVKINQKSVSDTMLTGVMHFFVMYILMVIFATLLVSLDNLDLATSLSGVLATIFNIGPGLSLVGPMGNFSCFSVFSKLVLTLCMLIGRLEIFPILLLFMPGAWKQS